MNIKMTFIEDSLNTTLEHYLPLLQNRILESTTYFGVKTLKNPLDFWVYQELIYQQKPDVVIEFGNNWGGSTLALAHLLDQLQNGRIVGVDIDQSKISSLVREHPRISLIESRATDCYDEISKRIGENERTLIIEDSSHTYENTLAVLRMYSPLVKPGGYFIVEDSICHHGLEVGPKPGPFEAIETFTSTNLEFEIDREKESFLITWNPKGFLKRKEV